MEENDEEFRVVDGLQLRQFTLAGNGEPKAVFATQVLPNFFATLGVKPALGREDLWMAKTWATGRTW